MCSSLDMHWVVSLLSSLIHPKNVKTLMHVRSPYIDLLTLVGEKYAELKGASNIGCQWSPVLEIVTNQVEMTNFSSLN